MIKKLRIKFVIVSTISVALMLLCTMISINLINFIGLDTQTNDILSLIVQHNGVLPRPDKNDRPPHKPKEFSREAQFNTRYFVVYSDKRNEILYSDMGNVDSITSNLAQEYAVKALAKNKATGYIDDYKYLITFLNGVSAVIFVDASRTIDMFCGFLINSSVISFVALLLVALLSYFISPVVIKPIASAYEKQKRFITNASHEIKTPLTIISANMDIVEMEVGESKWINSSKEQIARLTELVNDLVSLSRMEENKEIEKNQVLLSEMAEMVAESYEAIALSQAKTFTTNIESEIRYWGNEKSISLLFHILLENAFKYSNENWNGCVFHFKKTGKSDCNYFQYS